MIRLFAWMLAILVLVDQLLYHGIHTELAERMLTEIIARV
jgi:hypothetical protein